MHDPMLLLTGVIAVVTRTLAADRRSTCRPGSGLDRAGALVCRRRDQRGGRGGDHLEPDPRHGEHPGAVAVGALTFAGVGRMVDAVRCERLPARRLRGDRGAATSLAVALLTPMFVFLAFAAFQAAMWSHARTEARVVARDTAALVARSGVAAGDARASATAILEVRHRPAQRGGRRGHERGRGRRDGHRRRTGHHPWHGERRLGHLCRADRGDHAMSRGAGQRWRRDAGSSDALGLALLTPAAIGLAVVIVFLGRGVDSRATVQSAAESAAQAAAQERSGPAAIAAAEEVGRAMLVDPSSCSSPQVSVDSGRLPARRPGGRDRVVHRVGRRPRVDRPAFERTDHGNRLRRDRSAPRHRGGTVTTERRVRGDRGAGLVAGIALDLRVHVPRAWCGWREMSTGACRTGRRRSRSRSRPLDRAHSRRRSTDLQIGRQRHRSGGRQRGGHRHGGRAVRLLRSRRQRHLDRRRSRQRVGDGHDRRRRTHGHRRRHGAGGASAVIVVSPVREPGAHCRVAGADHNEPNGQEDR